MKKKMFFITVLGLMFNLFYAQTDEDKKKILDEYNLEKINELRNNLKSIENLDSLLIQNYLKLNKNTSMTKFEKGKIFKLVKILDGKPIYCSVDNNNSAKATRTNFLQPGGGLGLDLEGENMHVAVWDEGLARSTHQEFFDNDLAMTRIIIKNAGAALSDHGTHVSGTITAAGVSPPAKGMAPKATLSTFDWTNHTTEVINEILDTGLLLSNHSYGTPVDQGGGNTAPTWLMGCYDSAARVWDQIAYNAPYYLPVISAGNDGVTSYAGGLLSGYDKLTGNKNSKNALIVANANNPTVNANGELVNLLINASSSQGPTDDGRIKPDITADGTSVFSTASGADDAYSVKSGTSMAAPNTAGTLLLLQEYYNQLNSTFMKASTLKALICHTADDDNIFTGPDSVFGWGLLNGKVAAETILKASNNEAIILESNFDTSTTYSLDFFTSGTSNMSATICWTDPAGVDHSTLLNDPDPVLVNDLDIRITKVGSGDTFFPWKLQLSNIAGQAIKGDNIVDNIEKIDIDNPVPGAYNLTVSFKGFFLVGGQDFSLILTGSDLTLSTNDYVVKDVSIWPNPARDIINISFKSFDDKTNISVYDIHGRKVYEENNIVPNSSNIVHSINVKQLSKGVYFLNIQNGTFLYNHKIIVD